MNCFRLAAAFVSGVILAAIFIASISVGSGLLLGPDRLATVVQHGMLDGQFIPDPREEHFSECSLLMMQFLKHENIFLNAIDSIWSQLIDGKPCLTLQTMVQTNSGQGTPFSYVNYPFGSRHLLVFVLSILSVQGARILYEFLSYGSVVALLIAAFYNSPRAALTILPVGIFLLFAFQQHQLGHNLAHAPAYFSALFGLAVFLGARTWFQDRSKRIALVGFVAGIVQFFDILNGAVPVILSLMIVLNHFFYIAPATYRNPREYWFAAIGEAIVLAACFLIAFVALTAVRLLILSESIDGTWLLYFSGLFKRTANELSGNPLHLADIVKAFWFERGRLTTGGNLTSTWVLLASAGAWIIAILSVAFSCWRHRNRAAWRLVDFSVVVISAGGVLAWYAIFLNHTVGHPFFMVRTVAIPASYGFVALIVMWTDRTRRRN
jgi:hypothetical protein